MAYTLREGQGSLFRNEKKTTDKHPNARGEILIEGVLYELSSWTKEGQKGKFQSLQAKRKEVGASRPKPQSENNSYGDNDFDNPF